MEHTLESARFCPSAARILRPYLRRHFCIQCFLNISRKENFDRRAAADSAFNSHSAAGLLRKRVHLAQSETRTFSLGFGRVQGLEGVRDNLRSHAFAGIAYG